MTDKKLEKIDKLIIWYAKRNFVVDISSKNGLMSGIKNILGIWSGIESKYVSDIDVYQIVLHAYLNAKPTYSIANELGEIFCDYKSLVSTLSLEEFVHKMLSGLLCLQIFDSAVDGTLTAIIDIGNEKDFTKYGIC